MTARSVSLAASVLALSLWGGSVALGAQSVPYERFTLDNGLTVILHEDHSAPLSTVNLWVHVGSKDEPRDRTGFAHLFEHLMFMGTARVPGSGFDDLMEEGGGWNNASTSPDRTNYYSVGPIELLPTLLWLDADRFETVGRDMTDEKVASQIAVVLNEYRQSYENAPYGKASLAENRLLYPPSHPYHVSTIGEPDHVRAATVEDCRRFFAAWYVPNNASLVVAGDFEPGAVRPLIEELFGTLPRGDDPVRQPVPPGWEAQRDALPGELRHTVVDQVRQPQLRVVFHSPPLYADGDAELDLLAGVLADGPASRLYQRLVVDEGLATDVGAWQASGQYGSTFTVLVEPRAGADRGAVEVAVDAVLAELAAEPVAAEELGRHVVAIERATLSGLQSLQQKADRLNAYQYHFGEPDSFARDLDRYRIATPDGARAWAERVFATDRRLVLWTLSAEPAPEADPRDARPEPLAAAAFEPPAPDLFTLGNGIAVRHFERPELPLVSVRLVLDGGADGDAAEAAGRTALAMGMLDEGADGQSAAAFQAELAALGAELESSAGDDRSQVALDVLARNLDPALDLAAAALLRPDFAEAEWARVHDLALEALESSVDSPGAVATRVADAAFFGADHPLGRPASGTPETVGALTRAAAVARWRELARPSRTTIWSAGAVDAETLRASLERAFGSWPETRDLPPPAPEYGAPAPTPFRVQLVHRPGAVQTIVRFVFPAPPFDDAARTDTDLLATVLGGTFTSRLNSNLREDKGWTYGAGAGYTAGPRVGKLVAQAGVQVDATGPAVGEFLAEFARLRTGDVSPEETAKASKSRRLRTIERLAGLGGLLGTAVDYARNGASLSALGDDLAAYAAATPADLNARAGALAPLDGAVLVLVGDREAVLPQLDALRESGVALPEVVEVDAWGRGAERREG